MGLFNLIGKAYWGIVHAVADPISRLLGVPEHIIAEDLSEKPFGKVLETGFKVATTGLAVVSLPATIPIIAKGIVAKPVVALVGAGLLVTKGGRALIEKGVVGIVEGGKALGEAYEVAEEKGEELGIGEALKVAGLVGAGLVLGAGAPAIIEKVKEFTGGLGDIEAPPKVQIIPETLGKAETPILPKTEVITTTKKPTQRRRAKKTPSVRNYVRVNIINSPTNRNYLKAQMLTN